VRLRPSIGITQRIHSRWRTSLGKALPHASLVPSPRFLPASTVYATLSSLTYFIQHPILGFTGFHDLMPRAPRPSHHSPPVPHPPELSFPFSRARCCHPPIPSRPFRRASTVDLRVFLQTKLRNRCAGFPRAEASCSLGLPLIQARRDVTLRAPRGTRPNPSDWVPRTLHKNSAANATDMLRHKVDLTRSRGLAASRSRAATGVTSWQCSSPEPAHASLATRRVFAVPQSTLPNLCCAVTSRGRLVHPTGQGRLPRGAPRVNPHDCMTVGSR